MRVAYSTRLCTCACACACACAYARPMHPNLFPCCCFGMEAIHVIMLCCFLEWTIISVAFCGGRGEVVHEHSMSPINKIYKDDSMDT